MRLHDKLYLKSNLYKKPKENFKFLQKILKKDYQKKKNIKLLILAAPMENYCIF